MKKYEVVLWSKGGKHERFSFEGDLSKAANFFYTVVGQIACDDGYANCYDVTLWETTDLEPDSVKRLKSYSNSQAFLC